MARKPIFRQAALDAHARGSRTEGRLLHLDAHWSNRTYPFFLLVLVTTVLAVWLVPMDEQLTGVAVVQVPGQRLVRAESDGLLLALETLPGETVRRGTSLGWLERPDGSVVSIEAPGNGILAAVRIEPGDRVQDGDVLASIQPPQASPELIVLFPARRRERLEPGQPLRLELDELGRLPVTYRLREVAEEPVVFRTVEPLIAGSGIRRRPQEPVVLGRAELEETHFELEGRSQRFLDGMSGTARVRIGRERVLYLLFPRLREVLEAP